jgi:hypothetical protein
VLQVTMTRESAGLRDGSARTRLLSSLGGSERSDASDYIGQFALHGVSC